MKNMTTLEDLKKKAFAISTPIEVVSPRKSNFQFIPLNRFSRNNTYSYNRGVIPYHYEDNTYSHDHEVIAFYTEDVLYVIPFTCKALKILEDSNLSPFDEDEHFDMYIPFSECDYPAVEKEKWFNLKKEAFDQRSEEFDHEILEFCEKYDIGSIDGSLLEKCFEIPKEGLIVEFSDSTNTKIFPVSPRNWINFTGNLGYYNCYKGTYAFVYRNGKTYVTHCHNVVLALKEVGYVHNYLSISPFDKKHTKK